MNKFLTTNAIVVTFTAFIFAGIGYIFWRQEVQYLLPTPRPKNLTQPIFGASLDIPFSLLSWLDFRRPTLLHFFNPDCPCSRFNLEHVTKLIHLFKNQVNFLVVAQANENRITASLLKGYGLEIPIILDFSGEIARTFGVYSTPQAVILTKNHSLYYRGNYNSARYHTHKKSEYARLAIENLLQETALPPESESLSLSATRAWGCNLPSDRTALMEER